MRRLLVALALAAAFCAGARAQGQDSKSAPISIETDAAPVPVGTTIVLRGRTIAADARRPIAITVTWLRSLAAPASGSPAAPPPAPQKLSAPYGADGAFEASYRTEREGLYRATATSPDGSGAASAEFKVSSIAGWTSDQGKDIVDAVEAASDLVDALEQTVAEQPDSPAKQQFQDKLQPLKKALAGRKAAEQSVTAAFDHYGRIAGEFALTAPAFAPLTGALKEWKQQSAVLIPQIKEATAAAKKRNRICDELVKVEEGFKLLSTLTNAVGKAHEVLLAFTLEFATSVAADRAPNGCADSCKFAFGQAVKQNAWVKAGTEQIRAKSFAAKAFFDGVPSFIADVGAFGTRALFDNFCDRFEGPMDGSMKVEYYKDDKVWWRYTVKIKGQMTLVYRKGGDPKQAIPMSGHVVGTGTEFTVAEDALRVLKPKLLAGAMVVGKTTAPIGFPYLEFPGAMALQAAPTAFFIAVEGELADNTLKIKLGPTRTDFSKEYTVAKGKYVIAGGYAGAFAGYTTFDIPYDSARGLIEKATDIDVKPIELPVSIGKDKMTATATFKGERGKAIKARGQYELKLKLCNPKC
jgi:hypothetical protein